MLGVQTGFSVRQQSSAVEGHEHRAKVRSAEGATGAHALSAEETSTLKMKAREIHRAQASGGPTLTDYHEAFDTLKTGMCPDEGSMAGYGCKIECDCKFYQLCNENGDLVIVLAGQYNIAIWVYVVGVVLILGIIGPVGYRLERWSDNHGHWFTNNWFTRTRDSC